MDKIEELIKNKERLKIKYDMNKLTGREKIKALLDEGSFIEFGGMADENGGGVITGYGTIDGRLSYIYSYDYAVKGGAVDSLVSKKICDIMDMAAKVGAPLIHIYDSIGAKLTEGLSVLASYGNILKRIAKLSGVIPQVSVIVGPCVGISAIGAAMSDFTIMVENQGQLYVNSPEKLIENEERFVETSMYADAVNCNKNGSIQITVNDEYSAFNLSRKIFSYIPSNNLEISPLILKNEVFSSIDESLNDMVKEENVNIKDILNSIADENSIIELNNPLDNELITALVRINGLVAGVIGIEGKLNILKIDKISRMTKICNCFNIPIINIVNSDGFVECIEEEKKGLALAVSKMACSLIQADVPKISLIPGKAYGAIYTIFAEKEAGMDLVYAWPSAEICITEPEKLIESIYREEILASDNPKEAATKIIQEHLQEVKTPYNAVSKGYINDIIIPSETKVRLFSALDMLQTKREVSYPKKHTSTLI